LHHLDGRYKKGRSIEYDRRMGETLEERLAQVEARFALGDLVARYFDCVDRRDVAGVVADFAPDGEFSYPGGSARGRADLHAFWSANLRWDFTYHYPHAHVVRFTGPTIASGYVDAHAEHQQDGGCVVAALRYVDEYVLRDGRWVFQRRDLRFRYFLPVEKLSTPSYRLSATFRAT
jgi:ketosteroid isomerase-like protein